MRNLWEVYTEILVFSIMELEIYRQFLSRFNPIYYLCFLKYPLLPLIALCYIFGDYLKGIFKYKTLSYTKIKDIEQVSWEYINHDRYLKEMGYLDKDWGLIKKYYAELEYGRPQLSRFTVKEETDKEFMPQYGYGENLIGYHYFCDKISKDSKNSGVFDSINEAAEWLTVQCNNAIKPYQQSIIYNQDNINDLTGYIGELNDIST